MTDLSIGLDVAEPDAVARARATVSEFLLPLTPEIDQAGLYPGAFMAALGRAGGFAGTVPAALGGRGSGVNDAIAVIEEVSAACVSTGFCTWCQVVCAYYIQHGDSELMQALALPEILAGSVGAGSAMSNPMKHFAGIEPLRVRARRRGDRVRLDGMIPWLSNVEAHRGWFGLIAAAEEGPMMLAVPAQAPGISFMDSGPFIALEGSSTHGVRFDGVELSPAHILAWPVGDYLDRVRPGFLLMQIGIALGHVRSCITLMRESNQAKAVNAYLPDGPDRLEGELLELRAQVNELGEEIGCGETRLAADRQRQVIEARLAAAELALRAGQAAMLHAGAAGFRRGSVAERRMREATFIAIVTPGVKHLHKLLQNGRRPDGRPQ
jgi:alkylation response protein AidB-like acyl-CoA dehydrogenase